MNFRARYVVYPKIQYTVVGISIVLSILSAGILYGFFILYFNQLNANLMELDIMPGHPACDFLQMQRDKVQALFYVIAGCVASLNALVMVLVTHRIVGPVYRINKALEDILENKADYVVKVRKGDFFAATAELVEKVRLRGLKG